MATFQTKAGRALAAAFDPNTNDARQPNAKASKPPVDSSGKVTPFDRTEAGVVYNGDTDEAHDQE